MNGVVICVCCWGLWVLEILEQCVEVDEAAVTVAYGDGRDDSLIDKALDQPGVDGGVRVELVELGDCLGDISHSYLFHFKSLSFFLCLSAVVFNQLNFIYLHLTSFTGCDSIIAVVKHTYNRRNTGFCVRKQENV